MLDTRKVTNMSVMLASTALTEIPLFNTANVTNMYGMCSWNSSLTSIPLFDTSSVTDVRKMFQYCPNVESGALALYQRMSSQTTPPTQYSDCFACGYNTTTGSEERAQIPTDWGGTMSV
jgi:surface protein